MPTVVLESPRSCTEPATVVVTSPDGGRLLDLVDAAALRVPLSCRSADCGACLIEVLEGEEQLLPPDAREMAGLQALDPLGAERDRTYLRLRLACQARMRPGDYLLRLRAHDKTKHNL
jgi:ferredoxin